MSKKEKELQFVEVDGKKVYEIIDTLDMGAFKHNCRLVKDFGDGRFQVEHSVFHDKAFLGNVKTILYGYDSKGKKLFSEEILTPKGNKLLYDRNRAALQDSKNDFRGSLTRESQATPENIIGKQIAKNLDVSKLTPELEAQLIALGVSPESIVLAKKKASTK